MEWYYETPSGRKGPVTSQILKKLFIDGHIDNNTLVWNAGMQNWIPIIQCMDLLYTDKPKTESKISFNATEFTSPVRWPSVVKAEKKSNLSIALFLLAGLSLVIGLIACLAYAKEASEYSNEMKALSNAMSIASLLSGITGAVLFLCLERILVYLNRIEINTRKDKNQL